MGDLNNKHWDKNFLRILFVNYFEKNPPQMFDRVTAQKMKFSIKDFFSKCERIRRKLQIWSYLLKKSP